jgi:hypothetical protein
MPSAVFFAGTGRGEKELNVAVVIRTVELLGVGRGHADRLAGRYTAKSNAALASCETTRTGPLAIAVFAFL